MAPYVELELKLMTDANGTSAIMNNDWPYFVLLYVEEYVRAILQIELNGAVIKPWWYEFESNIQQVFRPYKITTQQLIEKYANETLRVSGCIKDWPKNIRYKV